ncbi:MAG: DUF2723 domain-containing protein [Elusimicrobia bacterium]|nr:DUF2723 domain-containing protein [Elusimicrobiota bacterium]
MRSTRQIKWLKYLLALSLFFSFFILYFKFLSRDFNFDGIVFAYILEHPTNFNIFHGNHLLYNLFNYCFYQIALVFGFSGRAIYLLAIVDAFCGALGIGIFYLLLRNITNSARSWWFSLLLGLSYSYWYFSVESQVYQLANVFLMLLLWLILFIQKKKASSYFVIIILSLIHALAVFFHILSVLVLPAANLVLLINATARRWRRIALYNILFISFVLIGYSLIAFYGLRLNTWRSVWVWFLGNAFIYEHYKATYWCFDLVGVFKNLYYGFINSLFAAGAGKDWFILEALMLCLSAGYLFSYLKKYGKGVWIKEKGNIIVAGCWLVVFLLFLGFWSPGHLGYRVFLLPVFYFLLIILEESTKFKKNIYELFLILWVIILFLHNFIYGIYPKSLWQGNVNYLRTIFLQENIKPDDFLLTGGKSFNFAIGRAYLPYFTNLNGTSLFDYLYQPQRRDFSSLKEMIDNYLARNRRVFVLNEIINDENGKKSIEYNFNLPAGSVNKLLNNYQMLFYKKFDNEFSVYQLRFKKE